MTTTSTISLRIQSVADDNSKTNLCNYILAALQTSRTMQTQVTVTNIGGPVDIDLTAINSLAAIMIKATQPIDISLFNDGANDIYTGVASDVHFRVFETAEQLLSILKISTASATEAICDVILIGSVV